MPTNDKPELDLADTVPPALARKSHGKTVKVRVTKMGAGKVSTGTHVAVTGDTMAKAGDILSLPQSVADALEARGLAEIQ